MRRPGWTLGLTWLVTCLIGGWLSLPVLLTVCVSGTVCFVLFLCITRLRRAAGLLPIVGTVCLAVLSLILWEVIRYAPLKQMVNNEVRIQGQVCSADGQVILEVQQGDLPAGTRLALWCGQEQLPVALYDQVEGNFLLCDRETNTFSRLQNKAGGVWFAVAPVEIEELSVQASPPPWTATLSQWRRAMVQRVKGMISGDAATVITGICLGADEDLSDRAARAFRETGVFHLFSVSGFHLALIAQGLQWLLLRLGTSRRLRAILISFGVLLFMGLVGLEPAVIRSGVLCLLVQISTCLRRQADSRNSLGLALLILLVADPYAAYDVGLLLSFAATFGLVLLAPACREWCLCHVLKRWIAEHSRYYAPLSGVITAICVTASATVATLPISVLFFGRVSLVSVLANLLSSFPATVLLLFGGIACLLLLPGWTVLAQPCVFVAGVIARYLLWIAEKISTFSLATVAITDTFLVLWTCGVVPLLVMGWMLAHKRGLQVAAALAALTLSVSMLTHTVLSKNISEIGVIPTDGEAAVYVQSDGRVLLICNLTEADTPYAVYSQLYRDGIKEIDVLVIPEGTEALVTAISSMWKDLLRDTIIICGEGVLPVVPQGIPLSPSMVLWEPVSIDSQDDFLVLTIHDKQVLISLGGGGVTSLPSYQGIPQVVVYAGEVPTDAALLRASVSIFQSPKTCQPVESREGRQRVLVAEETTVSVFVRGVEESN